MTIRTILFDLDDTLLGNDMESFLPRYFALLGEYARPLFGDSRQFLKELLAGTQAMIANQDRSRTNRDVFWDLFASRTRLEVSEAEAFFDRFYQDVFPLLQTVTERRPAAVPLVRTAFARGYRIAVATNPLFPRRAIEERLAWAGLPVSDFNFALVTTYENMHATKPHSAYYLEILEQLGAEVDTTLMVGDDWGNDVVPAASLGMHVYWIASSEKTPPEDGLIDGYGDLDDLFNWLFPEED